MAEKNFSKDELALIRKAISSAESNTSGEIRVHLENHCKIDVLDRAAVIFETLSMHKTKFRNGVLFYLAMKDHKFAILGDAGINQKVPANFWDDIKEEMSIQFKAGQFAEGLSTGIEKAGVQLKKYFPIHSGDQNELSDEISFGQ